MTPKLTKIHKLSRKAASQAFFPIKDYSSSKMASSTTLPMSPKHIKTMSLIFSTPLRNCRSLPSKLKKFNRSKWSHPKAPTSSSSFMKRIWSTGKISASQSPAKTTFTPKRDLKIYNNGSSPTQLRYNAESGLMLSSN